MKPSIADVLRSIWSLPPVKKVERLSALIALEPKRSIRRGELEAALRDVINKQMRREIRQDKKLAS